MKSSKFNYVSKFKYLMLFPIVIAFVAIIIGAIFNLNFDYDFKTVSNFNVKFNTTVTEQEYDNLESSLRCIIKDQDLGSFRLERIGSGAQNGILVKIPNKDGKLDTEIAELKTIIEENLLSETDNVESSVVISTTETGLSLPKNITNLLLLSILSIVCIIVFVFFYNWIRYNLMAGCSLALSIVIEIAILLSSMIAFRIPFNYYFVLPFVIMILTTIINSTLINNKIKSTLSTESYNKYTNSERVEEVSFNQLKPIGTYMIMLVVSVLSVMFFGGPSLIYLGLAIVVGLIVSAFTSLFVNTSLWSFWYNKEKDSILRRRIDAEKHREEIKAGKKKPDDKIVV